MINALIEGLLIGLGMIVFIGPVFFTLLQSSLQHGFKAGFSVALGILISDVVCVVLCYWGALAFFKDETNQFWLAIVGAVLLFVMGGKYILFPNLKTEYKFDFSNKYYLSFFTKGFAVNFINPFVFIVWVGIITYANETFDAVNHVYAYLAAALLGIFITDTLKAILADKLKRVIQPKFLLKAYKIMGVLLIGFAIRMIFFVI